MLKILKKILSQIIGLFRSLKPQVPVITKPAIKNGTDVLKQYLGKNEEENSDLITMLWSEFGRPKYDSTVAWCGLAVAIGEVDSGYLDVTELPKKFEASRRWLTSYDKSKYDLIKNVTELQPEDVAVRWRGSKESWQGHVSYFIGWDEDGGKYKDGSYKRYLAMGGNQSDAFTIKSCESRKFLGALRRKA